MREYLTSLGGYPQEGSYLDKILKRHEIDLDAAPVWSRDAAVEDDRKVA